VSSGNTTAVALKASKVKSAGTTLQTVYSTIAAQSTAAIAATPVASASSGAAVAATGAVGSGAATSMKISIPLPSCY
jgi:hypothetical protein